MKPYLFFCAAILVVAIATTAACKKGATNKPIIFSEDATILDEGDPAADGCGWLIKTSSDSTYNASALDNQYKINNLKIHIAYHKLKPRYYCGFQAIPQNGGITEIQLDSIRTK
jgi:hypothetical protein